VTTIPRTKQNTKQQALCTPIC